MVDQIPSRLALVAVRHSPDSQVRFHVHAADCPDLAAADYDGLRVDELTVSRADAVVLAVYPPDEFDYGPGSRWSDYADTLRWFPCAPLALEEAPPVAEQPEPNRLGPAAAVAVRSFRETFGVGDPDIGLASVAGTRLDAGAVETGDLIRSIASQIKAHRRQAGAESVETSTTLLALTILATIDADAEALAEAIRLLVDRSSSRHLVADRLRAFADAVEAPAFLLADQDLAASGWSSC